MDTSARIYYSLLKGNGYSLTQPRKDIFVALYSYGLQSMSQLIARCPQIDRASVYRTIDILESIEAVNRVPQGSKYKLELSEKFLPHHHHITCTLCGIQAEIELAPLEKLIRDVAMGRDFVPTSHKIELQGICKNCSSKT